MRVRRLNINEVKTSFIENTIIYINWYFHAPWNRNIGTLRKLMKGAPLMSSSELLRRNEMNYVRITVREYNDYLLKVLNNIIDQESLQLVHHKTEETKSRNILLNVTLVVPYSGKQEHTIKNKTGIKKTKNSRGY